jgi:hypothetical protein
VRGLREKSVPTRDCYAFAMSYAVDIHASVSRMVPEIIAATLDQSDQDEIHEGVRVLVYRWLTLASEGKAWPLTPGGEPVSIIPDSPD